MIFEGVFFCSDLDQDPSDHSASKKLINPLLSPDSSVRLINYNSSDLGLLILITLKERPLRVKIICYIFSLTHMSGSRSRIFVEKFLIWCLVWPRKRTEFPLKTRSQNKMPFQLLYKAVNFVYVLQRMSAYDVKTDTKRARELALDTTIPCAGGICNVFRSVSFVEAVDAGTFWLFFFRKTFVDFIKQ